MGVCCCFLVLVFVDLLFMRMPGLARDAKRLFPVLVVCLDGAWGGDQCPANGATTSVDYVEAGWPKHDVLGAQKS